MNTTTNHLPKAVLSRLFTSGLKQNVTALSRFLIIGLATLAAVSSQAAPKGGVSTGGGTIYYIGPWENATTGGTAVMTMMNSDGSNKIRLGLGLFGLPSGALHNGHRWFVSSVRIADQYYPDGTQRHEVFAFRDDYHYATNNNDTTRVWLTDDITLELWNPDWVPGDEQISFTGRRWSSAEPGATIVEAGLYTASLAFDADGNIIGLDVQPSTPAISLPLVESAPGDWRPDLLVYSWAPTADRIAYSNDADSQLWVASLLNVRTLIYNGSAHAPQWSPDNSKIAFTSGGICTIKPNGSAFKVIVRETSLWFPNHAHWSPTGSNLVFVGQSLVENNQDLFRVPATGGTWVNLTNTPAPFLEQMFEFSGGWR